MRPIASNIITELQSDEFRIFLLLDIEINSVHYRYTDCDVALVYEDNTYSPRGFETQDIRYSLDYIVDKMALSLDNLDDALTPLFVGGTPRGSTVILQAVALDENYQIITQETVSLVLTSFWEGYSPSAGIMPIIASDSILGLWEEDVVTGGLMPIEASALDDHWEDHPTSGGIMPMESGGGSGGVYPQLPTKV